MAGCQLQKTEQSDNFFFKFSKERTTVESTQRQWTDSHVLINTRKKVKPTAAYPACPAQTVFVFAFNMAGWVKVDMRVEIPFIFFSSDRTEEFRRWL